MRKGIRVIALFLACSLMLCGCGTPLFEVTEEEEALIVHYAAYVLAKHNVYQKDGMVAVSESLIEEETEETVAEETVAETESEEAADQSSSADASGGTAAEPTNTMTLAAAVGYEGQLEIVYTGFSIVNNFQEGKAYSLDAHSGYDFVVAQFSAVNISGEKLDVNIMDTNPIFRMSYQDNSWVKEDVTLLLTDLSTFAGSLESGQSVDLVLLFEVPSEDAAAIGEITLSVDWDGGRYLIAD